jgi:hypothetical protein
MHQFPKFTPAWNSTCYGQFLCPSSRVYSLYTQQWYMSYRFVDSFGAEPSWSCSKAVHKPVRQIPVLIVQWINSWWWAEELPETCRVSCRSKFGNLAHLVGLLYKNSHIFNLRRFYFFSSLTMVYQLQRLPLHKVLNEEAHYRNNQRICSIQNGSNYSVTYSAIR